MASSDTELPRGEKPVYLALRDAGLRGAKPHRNIPWINIADDGVTILNTWRRQLEVRGEECVAVVDARHWSRRTGAQERKRQAVVEGLAAVDGQLIRVVLLEERVPVDGRLVLDWIVEPFGWSMTPVMNSCCGVVVRDPSPGPEFPANPAAFGHMTPDP